jgi:hypothetical protein
LTVTRSSSKGSSSYFLTWKFCKHQLKSVGRLLAPRRTRKSLGSVIAYPIVVS